jgi:hypothetical protein
MGGFHERSGCLQEIDLCGISPIGEFPYEFK